MRLQEDLREFIALLNAAGVEYVIVGAHALAYHGCPRYTGDVDILVRVSQENARKLEGVIIEFGFGEAALGAEDFLADDRVIQLGVAPNRIDLLTTVTGVTFEAVWEGKVEAELDGVPVHLIGKKQFIQNKKALGRPKDLADLDSLLHNP